MSVPDETKIIYHVDDEETPYLVKIPKSPSLVTLGDFKNVINRPNYRFFFKSMDDDFGVVKEEIIDDDTILPCFNGRVVSWVVPPEEGSNDCNSTNSGESALKQGRSNVSKKDRFPDNESVCSHKSVRSNRSRRLDTENENRSKVRNHRDHRSDFDSSSIMSSDLETTSFVDSDEESRISSTTENSKYGGARQKRRRRKQRMPRVERCSSFSTITESTMSLNIITVVLNMDKINFLGISIVGQANKKGDGGIYVGSVMKGGAVDADGRIEPGDMILAVGDVNFENMSNDDAVRVLRECVHKPGPIMLTVAKCWDPNPKGYFTVPRNDVTRPIDPAAWMQHSEAVRASGGLLGGRTGSPSMSTMTSTSDSLTSSIPESDRYIDHSDLGLSIKTDMNTVIKVMASPDSGLVVRDRMWLKITIPNAFIGSDLVDWLFAHVDGFQDRRDARKYASKLLKAELIKHTVKKVTFSEQCYYVFGDLNSSMKGLILDDFESNELPLPHSSHCGSWVGNNQSSQYVMQMGGMPLIHPGMIVRGSPSITSSSEMGVAPSASNYSNVPPNYMDMYSQIYQPTFNPYFAHNSGSQGSQHTGSNSGSGGSFRGHQLNQQQQLVMQQQHYDYDQATIRSSSSSDKSRGSKSSLESKRVLLATTDHLASDKIISPDTVSLNGIRESNISNNNYEKGENARNNTSREFGRLDTIPREISASKQSFRMAMGNSSNEFFVDVM
ncbi:segment polarity protein dishevelled homolog DVL-3-like [Hydra vulgaris]|uniref:Dishevelled n=1 Tax=Hydra vulgaris TaxID=6087 RepID=Q9GTJ8_HYDVU|nr:segment polarity protein dishevelled homolog DVL-3-like [Hydra vulgaris]AAG13667.1 dishevelled [Hydra vulgaris]